MPVKPSDREEEYFVREEAERMRRLVHEHENKLQQQERERQKELHFMKCPKCGAQLEEIGFGDVLVDKCFNCEGMWLDDGELAKLQSKDSGFLNKLAGVFRSGNA